MKLTKKEFISLMEDGEALCKAYEEAAKAWENAVKEEFDKCEDKEDFYLVSSPDDEGFCYTFGMKQERFGEPRAAFAVEQYCRYDGNVSAEELQVGEKVFALFNKMRGFAFKLEYCRNILAQQLSDSKGAVGAAITVYRLMSGEDEK
ncbi:MAG: hypothetical protein KGH64_00690 [Candidatus Micrarchaeota archaeon]|nr:hypothetical protein [Candidatus Micrarchaeota archaeon]